MSGRGYVFQRSPDSWSIVIYLGRDPDGKKKQRWLTVRGTKKAAQRKLTSELQALTPAPTSIRTISQSEISSSAG